MHALDSAAREALARRVLELSTADQTEVLVATDDRAMMRFTHQTCHQNVAAADTDLSVRTMIGGRTGVARTNRLDEASLREVVESAMTLAHLAPNDPLAVTLPSGGSVDAPPGSYDGATAAVNPQARAHVCEAVFARAEKAGYWCAGYATTSSAGVTVANTSGACASFDGTGAAVNVKMNAPDSTGFAEAYAPSIASVDAAAIASTAAAKAQASAAPRSVEPGPWTVLLEPAAFGELMEFLADHFSAQEFDEGSSFCSDGLDRRYFAEGVTIYDDYAHPLAPSMPFDYEGHPKSRVTLVDAGVVRSIVTDSYYAAKLGRPNTGHALPAPNAYGPQPTNLVVAPGTKSFEQLVAETRRGLLVTRLWYVRVVDQKRAIVTGMTRDGTFMIENGAVTHGVRNLRFNQSILDALRNCEPASRQHRTGRYDYSMVVPGVKVEGFQFTSTTAF